MFYKVPFIHCLCAFSGSFASRNKKRPSAGERRRKKRNSRFGLQIAQKPYQYSHEAVDGTVTFFFIALEGNVAIHVEHIGTAGHGAGSYAESCRAFCAFVHDHLF